jgi:hypothetical protein
MTSSNAKRIAFVIMIAVLGAAFGGAFAWVWNRLDLVFSSRYVVVAAFGWMVVWTVANAAAIFPLVRWMTVKYPSTLPGKESSQPFESRRVLTVAFLGGLVVLLLLGLVIALLVLGNNPNGHDPLQQLH